MLVADRGAPARVIDEETPCAVIEAMAAIATLGVAGRMDNRWTAAARERMQQARGNEGAA